MRTPLVSTHPYALPLPHAACIYISTYHIHIARQWLGLALVGFALTFICALGIRGAYLVSLELLLLYFWGVAVFLAPLLLGTVTCFDFYSYIDVYFRHHWEEDTFLGIREFFCAEDTANNKCMSPIMGGGLYDNETAWCQGLYNATDCAAIREEATQDGLKWGRRLTLVEASVGECACRLPDCLTV